MKKKLLSFILAICMLLPCSLALTACGSNPPDNPHTHNWSTTWSRNSSEHWLTCDGCDEKKDKGTHTLVGGVCSVCGYEKGTDPNPSVPTVSSVRDLEIITYDTGTSGVFTLVLLPDGKNMVIDSGTESFDTQNMVEDKLKYTPPYISTIDYFVLSNAISAKTGQMGYILQNFNVANLYTPREIQIENQQHDDSYVYDCYLDALQYVPNTCNKVEVAENNCDITQSFRDNSGNTYSYTIDFMLPVSTEDCQNNTWHSNAVLDTTIVISIEYAGKTVLISGDATENNIDDYCTKYGNSKDVDVLITSFLYTEPYAIVNSASRGGNDYLASISLEANDYAIISPIAEGTRVSSLTDLLVERCQNNLNVFLLADESGLLTATVKITSAGVVSVTAE